MTRFSDFVGIDGDWVRRWSLVLGLLSVPTILISTLCSRPQHLEAVKADRVLILKKQHKLVLLRQGRTIKTYDVALGRGGLGPKERQGDHKTPEGLYKIDSRKANSRFYRALHISYPNDSDRHRASELGVPPGGEIMIHGIRNGLGWLGSNHRLMDWTDGCVAVTDSEIDEIWRMVPDGTPVEIRH